MNKIYFSLILFFGAFINANSQCNSSGGTNSGTLVPTSSFQTVSSVSAGNYYIMNVSMCNTYTFSFCQGGGSASWDTQITITDLTGAPISGAFNDDYCSLASELIWTPTVAGNVRVYITKYSCLNSGASGATLAYATVAAYTNTAEYTIVGNATTSGTCVTLTPNTTGQKGCAWDVNSTLNFLSPFSYDFVVNMGTNTSGGDGLTFTIQNDSRGRCACGAQGGSLGASGISNSLIFEIDTYLNTEDRDDGMPTVLCTGGPNPDHLDIWTNGNINPAGSGCPTPAGARVVPNAVELKSGAAAYDVNNGLNHVFRISWTPGSPGVISGQLWNAATTASYGIISYTFTPMTLFGTNTPYFGFTASTGGATNTQAFCNPTTLLPVELLNFEATKENKFSLLNWSTATEKGNKQFEIEHSTDALNWKAFSVVPSKGKDGNSASQLNYQAYDINPSKGINYYRLKQVDIDYTFKYSPIRTVKFDDETPSLNIYPNPASGQLNILLGDVIAEQITIYNSTGAVVFTNDKEVSGVFEVNTSQFAVGIYFVHIVSGQEDHSFKLVVNKNQ